MPMTVLRDKYRAREERRERVLAFLESARDLVLDREEGIEVNWWHPDDQRAPQKDLAAAVHWEPVNGSACAVTFGIQVLGTPEHILVPVRVVPVRTQPMEMKQERVVLVAGDVSRQHRTIENVADAVIKHAQGLIDAYLEKRW
jgi:hypothetical protein